MKPHANMLLKCLLLLIGISFGQASAKSVQYESLQGLTGLEIAFDMQIKNPKKADLFLKLIQMSFQDQDIAKMTNPPKFVVVFNGAAVTLISKNQDRFSAEERVYLQSIAKRIELMAANGIRIEGCLAAAKIFNVDPKLFLNDINMINNAWISLAGYQAQQFSMIPIH